MSLPEPNPLLISELFAMDPLKRTREQTMEVVNELRAKRALWVQNGTRAPVKAPKKETPKGGLSLDDLAL